MRPQVISAAVALVAFIVFIAIYDITLASEESKAYMMLLCAGMFFVASIVSKSGRIVGRLSAEAIAITATAMVIALVLFSLPIQTSMFEIIPRQRMSVANSSVGTLIGPLAEITIELVNAQISFESWNGSQYNVSYEIVARGLTRRSARRVLEETHLQIDDSGGDLAILLTGPDRYKRRVFVKQVIRIPRSMTPVLTLTTTNGTLNLSGSIFDSIDTWIGSGSFYAVGLRARSCDVLVDNGPIDLEARSLVISLGTISGDIRLVSLGREAEIELESVNGRIETYLNYSEDVGYRIEANSLGGSIFVNLTGVVFTKQRSGYILAKTKDYEERGEKTNLTARTTAGNVTVSQK